jgi:hypothetical protein
MTLKIIFNAFKTPLTTWRSCMKFLTHFSQPPGHLIRFNARKISFCVIFILTLAGSTYCCRMQAAADARSQIIYRRISSSERGWAKKIECRRKFIKPGFPWSPVYLAQAHPPWKMSNNGPLRRLLNFN